MISNSVSGIKSVTTDDLRLMAGGWRLAFGSALVPLSRGGALRLLPLLLEHLREPEIDRCKSEEEQRQPAHGVRRQEGTALDHDIKSQEGIDHARQVEHHDALLELLVH